MFLALGRNEIDEWRGRWMDGWMDGWRILVSDTSWRKFLFPEGRCSDCEKLCLEMALS